MMQRNGPQVGDELILCLYAKISYTDQFSCVHEGYEAVDPRKIQVISVDDAKATDHYYLTAVDDDGRKYECHENWWGATPETQFSWYCPEFGTTYDVLKQYRYEDKPVINWTKLTAKFK